MKISDILPNWTPVTLWASKHRAFTTEALALAQIKMGRESDDMGLGPRCPHKSRDTFRAPNGRHYVVTVHEVTVSDETLRAEIAELTQALNV